MPPPPCSQNIVVELPVLPVVHIGQAQLLEALPPPPPFSTTSISTFPWNDYTDGGRVSNTLTLPLMGKCHRDGASFYRRILNTFSNSHSSYRPTVGLRFCSHLARNLPHYSRNDSASETRSNLQLCTDECVHPLGAAKRRRTASSSTHHDRRHCHDGHAPLQRPTTYQTTASNVRTAIQTSREYQITCPSIVLCLMIRHSSDLRDKAA